MSSNSQLNVSSLFRSLKPESANAESINGLSGKKAEQRWPLLQSLPPTKWPLTPSLNESEKQARRIEGSADHALPVPRKPENLVPSIDLRIAEGLDRLFTKSKLIEPIAVAATAPTKAPLSATLPHQNLFAGSPMPTVHTSIQSSQVTPSGKPSLFELQSVAPKKTEFKSLFASDNATELSSIEPKATVESIRAMLARIENSKRQEFLKVQAASAAVSSLIKPPGFFSRLGKR
jgi:hypothetical protein